MGHRRLCAAMGWLLCACTAPNPAFWNPPGGAGDDAAASDAGVEPPPTNHGRDARAAELDAAEADDVAPAPADAAAAPDVPSGAADALARDAVSAMPSGCGTGTADVSSFMGADGLAIDTDGTIYVLTDDATNSYVGRIRPGKPAELKWLAIINSPTTWGLALDSTRKRLYVLVVDAPGALVAFDNITTTPVGRKVVTGITNPNDVVVDDNGTVFYSDQGDRYIYAVSASGGPAVRASKTAVGDAAQKQMPSALTMDYDGNLIVGLEPGGPLYQIFIDGSTESSRKVFGTWTGRANGLTFDLRKRLYVGIYDDTNSRDVIRLESDGTTKVITSGGRFSTIAFGRGALDCRDLYITDPYGPMRRVRVPDAY